MVDEIERAEAIRAVLEEAELTNIRYSAQEMPIGHPGECHRCGEQMPRLVNGVCAPCRDIHKLG